MAVTTSLKAYSHAYILITFIPLITSFITLILLSVILAAFALGQMIARECIKYEVPQFGKVICQNVLYWNLYNNQCSTYECNPLYFTI